MPTVGFHQMKDGTRADYELLSQLEAEFTRGLPARVVGALEALDDTLSGYQVTRLEHSLQAATRAEDDGADDEMILAALLHDLGDTLAPANHAELAAAILRPYVRPEVAWVVEHHGRFQALYYAHHFGEEPRGRDELRGHPYYDSCAAFCERWDQASFDPTYPTRPLEHFAGPVHRILSRAPFDPEIVGRTEVVGVHATDRGSRP